MNQKAWPYLALPLLAVFAVNAMIFLLDWDEGGTSFLHPPGALIGAVWIVWFVFMGVARWKLKQTKQPQASRISKLILWFMLSCLAYPFYTLGFSNQAMGLLGNAVTIVFAATIVMKAWPISKPAAWFLFPVIPWVVYATAIILYSS